MTKKFVMLLEFYKNWASMGLNDNDLRRLQEELLFNLERGDVMQGTGALHKLRFAFEGREKKAAAFVFVMWILRFTRAFIL